MNFPFFQKKPPENAKLLVWEGNGEIVIMQEGGIDKTVIDAYAALGQEAAFFDKMDPALFHNGYIQDNRLRERPQMLARMSKHRIKADGIDEAHILGVPLGAIVTITDGYTVIVEKNDGTLPPLTAPVPGCWEINIELFPYQPQRFVVVAE